MTELNTALENYLKEMQNNPNYPKNVKIPIVVFLDIKELWLRDPNKFSDEEKITAEFIYMFLEDKQSRMRVNQAYKPILHAITEEEKEIAYKNWQLTKKLGF